MGRLWFGCMAGNSRLRCNAVERAREQYDTEMIALGATRVPARQNGIQPSART